MTANRQFTNLDSQKILNVKVYLKSESDVQRKINTRK